MNLHPDSSWIGASNSPESGVGLGPIERERGRAAAGLEKWRAAGRGDGVKSRDRELAELQGWASGVEGRRLS